jgi:hypothetical protein
MNELQLSLLGLGLFAIILVVLYNRWVEHKHRKLNAPEPTEAVVEAVQAETDTATDRQEPVWNHGETVADQPSVDFPVEPVVAESSTTVPEPIAALTEVESWIDAIATLRFYEPRTAGSIRETLNQMGAARFERVDFYSGDGWHGADVLPNSAIVSNLRARLQLASRLGPVSPDSLHEWMRSLESLAQMLSAGLSVESEANLIDRAANLDAFCVRVDALISLNLKPRQDMASTIEKLTTSASALTLSGEFPNYARLSAAGEVDFQIQADQNNSLISLIMDFPHVLRPDAVVVEMLDLARTLSTTLDADIVDDDGRAMSEEGMAHLVNQVIRLNATLQAQGIEPGSALALRLFS